MLARNTSSRSFAHRSAYDAAEVLLSTSRARTNWEIESLGATTTRQATRQHVNWLRLSWRFVASFEARGMGCAARSAIPKILEVASRTCSRLGRRHERTAGGTPPTGQWSTAFASCCYLKITT
jgi:hypothetical protein